MHLLFIDPLEKLVPKKDSTLLLAHSLKELGKPVGLVFEEDFFFQNEITPELKVWSFESELEEEGFYLKDFKLTESNQYKLGPESTLHMRLDPPFDTRYMRYLWMLKGLRKLYGVKLINSPEGIFYNNEKLAAYELENAVFSFVGSQVDSFLNYVKKVQEKGNEALIFKPLDLYQGIGVKKVSLDQDTESLALEFKNMVTEYNGPVVVQPFLKEVHSGEIRSIYYAGVHMGSILKVPPKGEFLANIAQGATYKAVNLDPSLSKKCEDVALELNEQGVPWIAYDILGDQIQEINVTCPGLLVEVSQAVGENLAEKIAKMMD